MNDYYVNITNSSIFVKEAQFFAAQGGRVEKWGAVWIKVKADSIEDAREKGKKLKQSKKDAPFRITNMQTAALREMQDTVHKSCRAAGWYNDIETGEPIKRNFGELIALIHSEVSEALEGWRKNLMDDHLPERKMVEVELADTIIRILDAAGAGGLDVAGAIKDKFAYNQTRADHKIENRLKPNGKKI